MKVIGTCCQTPRAHLAVPQGVWQQVPMTFMRSPSLRQLATNIFVNDVDSPDIEEGSTPHVITGKETLMQLPDDDKSTFVRQASETSTAASFTHDHCDSQDSDAGGSEEEVGSWLNHDVNGQGKLIAVTPDGVACFVDRIEKLIAVTP